MAGFGLLEFGLPEPAGLPEPPLLLLLRLFIIFNNLRKDSYISTTIATLLTLSRFKTLKGLLEKSLKQIYTT